MASVRFFAAIFAILAAPVFADGDSVPPPVPAWPMAGTDADVLIAPDSAPNRGGDENIKIISKIGADMRVENNINLGGGDYISDSFSGGASMTQPYQAAEGFYPYENQSEMPFMHTEMPEDDGARVLSVSKSDRKKFSAPRYTQHGGGAERGLSDIAVDPSAEEQPAPDARDQVRSWVVASGQSLREVLQTWCDREGWDLVWNTPREYPIAASAVFKGRFIDVSSALVRNFSRAAPIPYAKFYKGNRVLVISAEEDS